MYSLVYFIVWIPCWFLFRVLLRWQVSGLEKVPSGGAIIAPNHQSFWDIPLVGIALRQRRVHFMAKSELFRNPVFAWVIRTLLAFPVKRGAPDRSAIRHAIEKLQAGDLVTIFPEGTRSKTGQLGSPEPGLSLIAAKAGVSVVPVAIRGTREIFGKTCLFPQIIIQFTDPILLGELQSLEAGAKVDVGVVVMEKIAAALAQNKEMKK